MIRVTTSSSGLAQTQDGWWESLCLCAGIVPCPPVPSDCRPSCRGSRGFPLLLQVSFRVPGLGLVSYLVLSLRNYVFHRSAVVSCIFLLFLPLHGVLLWKQCCLVSGFLAGCSTHFSLFVYLDLPLRSLLNQLATSLREAVARLAVPGLRAPPAPTPGFVW